MGFKIYRCSKCGDTLGITTYCSKCDCNDGVSFWFNAQCKDPYPDEVILAVSYEYADQPDVLAALKEGQSSVWNLLNLMEEYACLEMNADNFHKIATSDRVTAEYLIGQVDRRRKLVLQVKKCLGISG